MKDISKTIIALERAALEQWNEGDPSGYIELYADDITYFDPFFEQRMDGIKRMKEYYEKIRGKIKVLSYKMINPVVQLLGNNAAVLTYNLISKGGDGNTYKWNCTEVYRLEGENWKIAHNHWAFTTPA